MTSHNHVTQRKQKESKIETTESKTMFSEQREGNFFKIFMFHNLRIHEVPEYLRDNPHIKTGYRGITKSILYAFKTSLDIHNETFNMHTHFWAALYFLHLALYRIPTLPLPLAENIANNTYDPRFWLQIFVVGGIICFMLSFIYHTLNMHDQLHGITLLCDWSGIIFLISTAFFPGIYFGFYCMPKWQMFYLLSVLVIGTSLLTSIITRYVEKYRLLRVVLFALLAVFGVVPSIHRWLVNPSSEIVFHLQMRIYTMYLVLLIGVLVYFKHFPESYFTKARFLDIYFSSHQWWHVAAVIGSVMHYYTCERLYLLFVISQANCDLMQKVLNGSKSF